MSTLAVIGYEDQFKTEEVRLKLRKMQKEHLIDMEDAVVAVKELRRHQHEKRCYGHKSTQCHRFSSNRE